MLSHTWSSRRARPVKFGGTIMALTYLVMLLKTMTAKNVFYKTSLSNNNYLGLSLILTDGHDVFHFSAESMECNRDNVLVQWAFFL